MFDEFSINRIWFKIEFVFFGMVVCMALCTFSQMKYGREMYLFHLEAKLCA